jgi:hypothetical protein
MQVKHFSIVSFFLFCLTLMPVFGQNVSVEEITTVETAANRQGTKAGDGNRSVVFSKDKLIVVNKWIGLQIIDVSIVDQPKQVGVYRTASQNHSAIVDNNDIVYLAADDDGVYIIDISTPSNPRSLFRIRTKGTATAVALNGTTLAITEGNSQISVYDVTDVKNPTQTRGVSGADLDLGKSLSTMAICLLVARAVVFMCMTCLLPVTNMPTTSILKAMSVILFSTALMPMLQPVLPD